MPLILKIGCTHECHELSSQGIVSIQHVSVSGGHATPTFGRHRKSEHRWEEKQSVSTSFKPFPPGVKYSDLRQFLDLKGDR